MPGHKRLADGVRKASLGFECRYCGKRFAWSQRANTHAAVCPSYRSLRNHAQSSAQQDSTIEVSAPGDQLPRAAASLSNPQRTQGRIGIEDPIVPVGRVRPVEVAQEEPMRRQASAPEFCREGSFSDSEGGLTHDVVGIGGNSHNIGEVGRDGYDRLPHHEKHRGMFRDEVDDCVVACDIHNRGFEIESDTSSEGVDSSEEFFENDDDGIVGEEAPEEAGSGVVHDVGNPPRLEDLKHFLPKNPKRRMVDGKPEDARFDPSARNSPYFPYKNFTELALAWLCEVTQLSRAQRRLWFDVLRMKDDIGGRFEPAHVPTNPDHFLRDIRNRKPLLPVYEEDADGKDGYESSSVSFDFTDVLQRVLLSKTVVGEILSNPGGHVLTSEECERNNVPAQQLTAIPTAYPDGRRRGLLTGDIAVSSAFGGVESIRARDGGEVYVGDTVFACVDGDHERGTRCRLAGLVWEEDNPPSGGGLVAILHPFMSESQLGFPEPLANCYWEVVRGQHVKTSTEGILSRWETAVWDGEDEGGEVDLLVGFVSPVEDAGYEQVECPSGSGEIMLWRRSGSEGQFFDKRTVDGYKNTGCLPVFSSSCVMFMDGVQFFKQGGSDFSVNGTHLTFGATSPALRRRLSSWFLSSLGPPRGRWQEQSSHLVATLRLLERGCIARIRRGDHTEEVFLRLGLACINGDSPVHSDVTNTKHSNSSTRRPCSTCMVSQEDLGTIDSESSQQRRTTERILHDCDRVLRARTKTARDNLSKELGVTPQQNPIVDLQFDLVRQTGTDIFHQDALNTCKGLFRFIIDALNVEGKRLLATRVRSPSFRPPGTTPFREIVTEGGWKSQTGMDVWRLMSVSLGLFRPFLATKKAMVQFLTRASLEDINYRLDGVGLDGVRLEIIRLLQACSKATFLVRETAFNNKEMEDLHEAQTERVSAMNDVMGREGGGVLGTIHKGLHIARNIADLGETTNTCTGESLNKILKRPAPRASGRDNLLLIMRAANNAMADQAIEDGMSWEARAYDRREGRWTKAMVTPGPQARVLHGVFKEMLRRRESGEGEGRAKGRIRWSCSLPQVHSDDSTDTDEGVQIDHRSQRHWYRRVAEWFSCVDLAHEYDAWFGCGRQLSGRRSPCPDPRCPRCWSGAQDGLQEASVDCFNHWTEATNLASAGGTGTIRGFGGREAAERSESWMISNAPDGNDVELFHNREALQAGEHGGTGVCTLGKVAFFFVHEGNLPRRSVTDKEENYVRPSTVWVVAREYVTVGVGQNMRLDDVTGFPEYRLRTSLRIFPAAAIRRVVMMFHKCPANRCGPKSAHGRAPEWKCSTRCGDTWIMNEHYRGADRDLFVEK